MAFEETLKGHFDKVDLAENGQEAVDKAFAKPAYYYSVIILDISMPVMNGIEACKKIKEYFSNEVEKKKALSSSFSVPLRNSASYSLNCSL
mmetsp:Transcript_29573/g.36685  ORF Transcript_29573/g.36685 Transcript_29573/m.36685 type:complete len:91 (-) Transcript_29573:461-733(-)|eukprot:CAMPEP_0170454474 /NCGR_PEP_ID=MMETSP0123-20130129/2716_1 /TAXON_ID=182087 /ORGANISM="Favella ehrenbergii, Strain Fehren 1" /LENGTH=90 /DNA_ID=CAMNT_0010717203 /DNA_START=2540 /DNA_END=2812 /DNA_ORIENTATION=-